MFHKKKPEKNEPSQLISEPNSNGRSISDLFRRPLSRNKTILLLLIVVFIAMLVMSILILHKRQVAQAPQKQPSNMEKLLTGEDSSESVQKKIVAHYNEAYSKYVIDIKQSNPAKWDSKMLNKVYLSLLYADKVGDSTEVRNLSAQIELAKRSGVDIDNNEYNVTEDQRREIINRAVIKSNIRVGNKQGTGNE